MATAKDAIQTMFRTILDKLSDFNKGETADHATTAMLAQAVAEVWLIDDHSLDLESPSDRAEFAGDLRVRALSMLESHYEQTRGRSDLQRDLQRAATSLTGNIFTNDITRFAGLAVAVSEYLEDPCDNNLDEILATVVDSLHRARPMAPSSYLELTPEEDQATKYAASWAAHLSVDPAAAHPEDDALTFLATISAAAAVRAGIAPGVDPTRIAPLWAAFMQALEAYQTPSARAFAVFEPTNKTVARWVMIYGDLLTQTSDLVRIAGHLQTASPTLTQAVEAVAERQLGRPLAQRNKVQ